VKPRVLDFAKASHWENSGVVLLLRCYKTVIAAGNQKATRLYQAWTKAWERAPVKLLICQYELVQIILKPSIRILHLIQISLHKQTIHFLLVPSAVYLWMQCNESKSLPAPDSQKCCPNVAIGVKRKKSINFWCVPMIIYHVFPKYSISIPKTIWKTDLS